MILNVKPERWEKMMLLDDAVAIVTGAASKNGIGRAIAQAFSDYGARVAILDLDEGSAEQAAKSIGEAHSGYGCDVTRAQDVEEALSRVAEDLGYPSVLVNNAGITQPKRLEEITDEDYDAVLDVNLRGTLLCSRTIVPYMRVAGAGNIICMSSVSAKRGGGVFGGPHYSAAKAGILGLMRAMARDLAPEGIRVNAVAPGFINTDITQGQLSDDQLNQIAREIPMGRAGEAKEVANACLFLASELSSYVTGEVLDVNGGSHID